MAGVKQFDRNEVIERAMHLFWKRGYELTSIDDLIEATGVNRGSLYATFGDKRRLFLATIDRYWEIFADEMLSALSDPDPYRAIQGMFQSIIERISDPKFPRGCFITNTSLECPACDDSIARKIAELLARQEAAIYQALRRAQTEGKLDPVLDAKALARYFLGVAQGINVVHKAIADPEALKDIARVAMGVLRNPR